MENIAQINYDNVLLEAQLVIKMCLETYDLDEIFLSFNGGKDCTVLLDITVNVIKDIYGTSDKIQELSVIYFRSDNAFPELENFVNSIETEYKLNFKTVDCTSMKETLQSILNENDRLKACLMGTRKTDPYSSNLRHMEVTDSDWPQLMRVSPLLNWSYHQIWAYLIRNNIQYCSLYDKGYTSLGSTLNTLPNPSLRYTDVDGCIQYKPAYCLEDGDMERNGRVSKRTSGQMK